jgi:succinylglutamate desuccinylase
MLWMMKEIFITTHDMMRKRILRKSKVLITSTIIMNKRNYTIPSNNAYIAPIYISSWLPWPTLWVVAITHGNEPVWLDIFGYIRRSISLAIWNIILIPSNTQAYAQYIQQDDPMKYRYLDHDMNRIWDDTYIPHSREYVRREELKPILKECDIVLDIHSVSRWEDILGVADEKSISDARKWMNVEKILLQSTHDTSMTAWCARQGIVSFGLEAGNHISDQWYVHGIQNIQNILAYYGLTHSEIVLPEYSVDTLEFLEEVHISTDTFTFTRDFQSFNDIQPNEIIGYDGDKILRNTYTYPVVYGLVPKRIEKWKTGGFLFKKIYT